MTEINMRTKKELKEEPGAYKNSVRPPNIKMLILREWNIKMIKRPS